MSQSKPRNQFSGRTVRKSSAKNALKKRQQVSSSTPKVQILDKNNKVVKQVQTDEYGRLLTVPVYKKRKQMPRTKIYGQYQKNTLPVRVDESRRLETRSKVDVHTDTLTFYEQRQTVYTFNTYTPLPFEDISHAVQYVYLVHNQGDNDAEIFVELATDNENVVKDLDGTYALSAGQSKILTPLQFSRFIRIQYRSKTRDMSTKLHIVFQAQQVSAQTDNDGNS